jgi:DNA-binding XRE family transcriptional regulator
VTKATEDAFKPVPFNPKATAAKARAINPKFKKAYDALDDEFTALAALLNARKDAGLTQAEVASRMGVSQPVLARIESSLIKEDYSPSLKTLRRYAQACGKKLQIRLVDHTKPLSQR